MDKKVREVAKKLIRAGFEKEAQALMEDECMAWQKILTAKDRKNLPVLRSQENEKDPMVWVKFFNPYGSGTWFATEFDGDDTFFGYVMGLQEDELGYFSLKELQSNRVEREQNWKPMKLSQAKEYEKRIHGY